MTHRITAVSISNFKRVRDVKIAPSADRSIVLIAGKNRQGKSSVLDALTAAFGGKRALPADPVHHGTDGAAIVVELDNGALIVRRTVTPDGGGTLTITRGDGMRTASPQALLDKLVGEDRFLDPIAFLHRPASEQRAALLRIADPDGKIHKLEARREEEYAARTDTGRDLKKAQAEMEAARAAAKLDESEPDARDVAKLAAERATFAETQHSNAKLAAKLDAAAHSTAVCRDALQLTRILISDLEKRLADAKRTADSDASRLATIEQEEETIRAEVSTRAAQWTASLSRRDEIDGWLAEADAYNRGVYEFRAARKRFEEVFARVAELNAKHADHDSKIEKLDRRKLEVIAGSKLPVENLGVTKDGLVLNDAPFEQASGAERLRVALALAIAATPNLADVWIRDGALLDDESLVIVERHAVETGHTVWIERVGTSDAGAIVIQDGTVVP